MTVSFSQVVDLTHVLGPDFPTYSGVPELAFDVVQSFHRDRVNVKRWLIHEHIGTHIDAPIHFSDQARTLDQIPIETLIAPLAVVDISLRAQDNPDAELTPDDVAAWESRHGPIAPGSCVAMNSGWDRFANSAQFRNAAHTGTMHFPGVNVDAANLLHERGVIGIGVDTLSIDHGPSTDFPTHYAWLPANKWAIEGLANLAAVPAIGATIFVGAAKVKGATGGPSRIVALL
jgi:kynurenine formamidase